MSENSKDWDDNDTEEDRKTAYTRLIGLSILSSLVILSLWLLLPVLIHKVDPTGGLGGLIVVLPFMAVQWLLIFPATNVVVAIHKRWAGPHSVNPSFQTGIPLIANSLAANALLIIDIVYTLGFFLKIWGYRGN